MSNGAVVWIGLHNMSRTGVPIVLARLLRASSEQQRRSVHVIAMHGGPLEEELGELAGSVTVLEPAGHRSVPGALVTGIRSVAAGWRPLNSSASAIESSFWRARLSRLPHPDVLLLNGAGAWPLTGVVSSETQVVLHLHELETGLDRSVPHRDQQAAFDRASRVMVVSAAVADLARSRGASADKIVVVPGIVDSRSAAGVDGLHTSGVSSRTGPPESHTELDPDRIWVIGVGRPGWRKGTDRLAPIAYELGRRLPSSSVGWIGGAPVGQDAGWVDGTDPIEWIKELIDPWSVAAKANVIFIPSREDPLPLVALEAGQRGLPVVATPTGGLPELLSKGRGFVTSGQRLADLCDTTEHVLRNPGLAAEAGAALSEHVEQHHTGAVVASIWWDAILSDSGSGN
ncbi:MAG: glycosyltransferase family 4 protein [Microthrixaceae bacterium]